MLGERVSVEKLQGEHEGRDLFNLIKEQGRRAPRLLQGPKGPEIVSKPLGLHNRALVREMPLTSEFTVQRLLLSFLAANSSYKCVFTDGKAVL